MRPAQTRSTIQKRDAKGVVRHGAEWLAIWSDPDSMKSGAEKQHEAAAFRARLETEKNLGAAARSIAADPDLRISLSAAGEASFDSRQIAALRGQADSVALQHRFHDRVLHEKFAPVDPAERRLFDLCERVRCEAVGVAMFPGVRGNLAAQQAERLDKADLLNAHLALLIPVGEGLEMVLRDALTGAGEPSIPSSGLWMWDRWIRERFSSHLDDLNTAVRDQAGFSRVALLFIDALQRGIGSDERLKVRLEPSRAKAGDGDEAGPDERVREEQDGSVVRPGTERLDSAQARDVLVIEAPRRENAKPYKVFTAAHDRVAFASDLVDAGTLRQLRESLESRRGDLRRDLARLTARFQRRLLARQTRDWEFDLDEGLIDASRLDRVIVNPGFASAYKQERESAFRDTVVTILIDNSGSMRGKPIETACFAADLLAAALDRCGVASEILGFTTREWKGGQSAKDWVKAGRPADPGRLNDLLHIIYKAAGEPARRARLNLAAMLDPGVLKENIDGEALVWASSRLYARPERRKILIVISDGAPVDQATLEFNSDKQILDRHLRDVIRGIEAAGVLELTAIGVKHDAGQYYCRSIEIESPEALGENLIRMADQLLVSKA